MHDSQQDPAQKYFGTDGIRGVANRAPLTPDCILRLGQEVGGLLIEQHRSEPFDNWPSCLIGRDTRISGGMLEAAFAAGLTSVGVDATLLGVVPTPAVAALTRSMGSALGTVISASHNPYRDNGIKFFGPDGFKLSDAREAEIENRLRGAMDAPPPRDLPTAGNVGRLGSLEDATERYVHFVVGTVAGNDADLLRGVKIVLDAANGAAYRTSPAILRHLGADLEVICAEPNGVNINEDCGCTHPAAIKRAVVESGAHIGLAHDGDADRVLICDETGDLLDGDEIMAVAAAAMIQDGTLARNTLVTTIMSNYGINDLMASCGGTVLRTAVGDRHVVARMRAEGLNFGGEQSGHFIFADHATTGDGIVAALRILQIMTAAGRPLSELRKVLRKYPQAQRNLDISSKPPIEALEAAALIRETEEALRENGRVLLRYSGTEPKIRLLIEGKDAAWIEERASGIAEAITAQIGT